jgi:hypothetical protein
MIKSIYIETTIISCAASRLNNDLSSAVRKISTQFFWENLRPKFNLFTSSYAIEECKQGCSEEARRRAGFLDGISIIPDSERISDLAAKYLELLGIDEKDKRNCFHLAASAESGIDCLLSWNLRHFNISTYSKLLKYNEKHGLMTPFLLTPEALAEMTEMSQEELKMKNYYFHPPDPLEEVRRNRELLLEKYGGLEGLSKHLDEERPKWEKQGWKFLSEEEMAALRNRRVPD